MNLDTIRLAEAAEVVAWVRGRRFGTIEVLAAAAAIETDPIGNDAMYFRLVVSDPPPGLRSWPYDDVRALRDAVIGKANEIDIGLSSYVQMIGRNTTEARRIATAG